jgi:uncharacterized membrane protein YqgA involved in biofilm formation
MSPSGPAGPLATALACNYDVAILSSAISFCFPKLIIYLLFPIISVVGMGYIKGCGGLVVGIHYTLTDFPSFSLPMLRSFVSIIKFLFLENSHARALKRRTD